MFCSAHVFFATAACVVGCLVVPGTAQVAEKVKQPVSSVRDWASVAVEIDRHIDSKLREAKVPASQLASDAEFLRRVYVDITGKIPSEKQAAAFLDSKDPARRQKLIEELLASPDYGRNFGIIWRNLILKRDEANRDLDLTPLSDWLAKNFNQGRGWNEIVADMLLGAGSTNDKPQLLFYVANRDMNKVSPAKIVSTTGGLFMGVHLQCAECHNHPFTRQWKQTDFWGLAAFFRNVENKGSRIDKGLPVQTITESSPDEKRRRGRGKQPEIMGAAIAVPDPTNPRQTIMTVRARLLDGEEPKLGETGPYRPTFVKWLTAPQNPYFADAAVNRLWSHFLGRGFVNPLDDFQENNPPSHPELLKLLSREFVASGFDYKHLIRCICNSNTYQRTSQALPDNKSDTVLFSHQTVKVMSPEVFFDSLLAGLEVSDLDQGEGGMPNARPRRTRNMSNRQKFIRFFDTREDDDDRTDFAYGIPHFLRLINSPQTKNGGVIVDRLMKRESNPGKVIEGLYLATLSRRPTAEEAKRMAEYVSTHSDRKKGYAGVLWVLLNSAEFVCVR